MQLVRLLVICSVLHAAISAGYAADEVTERAVPGSSSIGGKTGGSSGAGALGGAAQGGTAIGGAAAGAAAGMPSGGAAPQAGAGAVSGGAGAFPGGAATGAAGGAPPRAGVAPLSLEQRVVLLEQQLQALTAQLAALQSVLKVTPTGAILQAPSLSIFGLEAININSKKLVAIEAGTSMNLKSLANTSIKATSGALIEASATLDLKGAVIKHNGGGKPLATVGSHVQVPGQPIGQVTTGSQTVLGN